MSDMEYNCFEDMTSELFIALSKKYGMVNYEGKEIAIIQDPYSACITTPCYEAVGVDLDGTEYEIRFPIRKEFVKEFLDEDDNDNEFFKYEANLDLYIFWSEDESEMCTWKEYTVRPL